MDKRLVLRENNQPNENETDQVEHEMQQPRQPRNMQDLLRYAIEAESQGERPVVHQELGPLDPERREFLDRVLSSMTVDLVQELKNNLSILQSEYNEGDDTEEFEEAFEQITDLIDNIDLANDFCKLGGFEVCKTWLLRDSAELKWRAANVVGECCQNNPFCQNRAIEYGLLKIFMDYVQNDSNENVKLKSFHGLSSIIRNNESSLLKFLSLNGHKLLLNCLKSTSNRLKTKALFFTSVIANEEGMLRDQLWDIGFVSQLVDLISTSEQSKMIDDVSCLEQSLSALLCLLKGSKKSIKNKEDFIEKLDHLNTTLGKQPAYLECVDHINSIKKIITLSK